MSSELMPTEQQEIKSCPFCGLVPDANNPATFQHEVGSRWASVVCCIVGPEIRAGIYTPLEEWKDEAIAAWNERTVPAPAIPPEIADMLREALDDSELYTNALERVSDAEKQEWAAKRQVALAWLDSIAK